MFSFITFLITAILLLLPFVIKRIVQRRETRRLLQSLKVEERQQIDLLRRGDFPKFKALVESIQFNPQFREPVFEDTLLMLCAADDNKINFAKYLIEKGCDVNAVNKKGMDLLFMTTYYDCHELFDLVMEQKNLLLDRSNISLGFEMNPLSTCIFKLGGINRHKPKGKDMKNANQQLKSKKEEDEGEYYNKAVRLLLKGARPEICRKIIKKAADQYGRQAEQEFEPLFDLFERWHGSKKIFLMNYYLANQHIQKNSSDSKKYFAIEKLPSMIVAKIADEYL